MGKGFAKDGIMKTTEEALRNIAAEVGAQIMAKLLSFLVHV